MSVFSAICFITSVNCYEGYQEKPPEYIRERLRWADDGVALFLNLDSRSKYKVLDYCKRWGVPIPHEISKFMAESERFGLLRHR